MSAYNTHYFLWNGVKSYMPIQKCWIFLFPENSRVLGCLASLWTVQWIGTWIVYCSFVYTFSGYAHAINIIVRALLSFVYPWLVYCDFVECDFNVEFCKNDIEFCDLDISTTSHKDENICLDRMLRVPQALQNWRSW